MGLRRAVNEWGTIPAERAESFPCDGLIEPTERELFRAVNVDAPAPVVFRWLCQLRVGPYSYDVLDNFPHRSPRRLIDGLEQLEIGQPFMRIFELVDFEPGRSITLRTDHRLFGPIAVTYRVEPVGVDGSRLLAKLAVGFHSGAVGALMRRVLPAGDLIMMRKQLLTLKQLAERELKSEIA